MIAVIKYEVVATWKESVRLHCLKSAVAALSLTRSQVTFSARGGRGTDWRTYSVWRYGMASIGLLF